MRLQRRNVFKAVVFTGERIKYIFSVLCGTIVFLIIVLIANNKLYGVKINKKATFAIESRHIIIRYVSEYHSNYQE